MKHFIYHFTRMLLFCTWSQLKNKNKQKDGTIGFITIPLFNYDDNEPQRTRNGFGAQTLHHKQREQRQWRWKPITWFSWQIRSLIAVINAMTASTVELKSEEKRNRNPVLPSPPFSRNLIVNLLSMARQDTTPGKRAPVWLLVEHRAVTREVVSSTPAEPSLRVLK